MKTAAEWAQQIRDGAEFDRKTYRVLSPTFLGYGLEMAIGQAQQEAFLAGQEVMREKAADKAHKRYSQHDTKLNVMVLGHNSGKTIALSQGMAETLMKELEADIRALPTVEMPTEGEK